MNFFKIFLKKHKNTLRTLCLSGIILLVLYFAFKPSGSLLGNTGFSQIIYDRHGQALRLTLSDDDKYRIFCHFNSAGPMIKQTILMKEDRYFYYHPGVNPVAVVRAFYQTYAKRDKKIGGSTITMQVARLRWQLKTRTIAGKLKQMFYALYLELYYSKNDILEAYINIVPCGGNIEGFAAASMIYFAKMPNDLTLHEALFLSVLPQNPSAFRPKSKVAHKEFLNARERLFKLWETNHPDTTHHRVHMDMPLNIQYNIPFHAPHFTTSLLQKYPQENKIHSTLDLKMQEIATRLTTRYIQRKKNIGVNNAAVLLVHAKNMEILAALGSSDFFNDEIEGQVNGILSRRSPGSTLKPFIYGLAMEQGLIHPMTMLKDAPISFSEYAPDNYERDFKGPVKVWEALVTSRNVPAVALASKIKGPDLYDFLHKAKIGDLKEKDHYGLSIVLGSAEFNMAELAALYGILSNEGIYRKTTDVLNTDRSFKEQQRMLSPEVSYLVRHILELNPKLSLPNIYSLKKSRVPVGYKTGTSIGFKDCWSIGLFDDYILAVWLGNFNGTGNPVFNGRGLATPLMFEIIESLIPELVDSEKYLVKIFPPETVIETDVCAVSGQLAHPHCRYKASTLYIPGKSPIEKCTICREIYVNTKTGYRTFKKEGKFIEKQVVEFWPTDLLALFKKAGIPRKTTPPFDPKENLDQLSVTGIPPEIISPLSETEYLLQPGMPEFNNLPLKVTADADVQEVYWFLDNKFIGKTAPDKTEYWNLKPGEFTISVVDDHGRSDSRKVTIGVVATEL